MNLYCLMCIFNSAAKFKSKYYFSMNAYLLYIEANNLVKQFGTEDQMDQIKKLHQVLEQMLHSILFIGNIQDSKCCPEDIFSNSELHDATKKLYPGPFKSYETHLPKRTPFSYFLELVWTCVSPDEEMVKTTLCEVYRCHSHKKKKPLISPVICICEFGSSRYCGASLSCRSKTVGKIMTAVSCAHVWHRYVSSAVMTSINTKRKRRRKNRSIKILCRVECNAYCLKMKEPKKPCLRCHELFSLPGHTRTKNYPGNCAETEAISNLLHAERSVSNQTIIINGAFNQSVIKQRMQAYFEEAISEWRRNDPEQNQSQYSLDKLYVPQQ
ncbi:uncharacterized protein LOC134309264 [Trichomycterus rosablanca]|uniref:uncharacterized protein LOC134309264 n=1 Tax=Trichomycterus rosablanca TaxID=2290929 RepID=UPI002F358AD7